MLFISGDERYIGTTSAVLLGSSTGIALFIILSNPKNIEVQKFKLVFLGVGLWFFGEFSYTYYQILLGRTLHTQASGKFSMLQAMYP